MPASLAGDLVTGRMKGMAGDGARDERSDADAPCR